MVVAPYAIQSQFARGRLYAEEEDVGRTPWQRDRDRIIHSSGFRKLQYKTQVFINHEGDYFRTRLTHSLEVAQIARSIARRLNVNEDLTEALALAHDLGHTPFGHAGENALNQKMLEESGSGFDHNTQSLRQVTKLEACYFGFPGLNLTWETLEGLAKHNGPVIQPTPYLKKYDGLYDLNLNQYASIESQIASVSDDIAYHAHDMDDGLRAGLLRFHDIEDLPLVGKILNKAKNKLSKTRDLERRGSCFRREIIRQLIHCLVNDLVKQTEHNLAIIAPQAPDDIRNSDSQVVGFSPEMHEKNKVIRAFLYREMYGHWRVRRMTSKAKRMTELLFDILAEDVRLLPAGWRTNTVTAETKSTRRLVADYIAGMTDRFAIEEYRRLTDINILA